MRHLARFPARIAGIGLTCAAVLAACGGDDNGGGQTTPPATSQPVNFGFEPYAQQEVKQTTCDTTTPVTLADKTFTFGSDQDTAEPRDLSGVTPGCTQ